MTAKPRKVSYCPACCLIFVLLLSNSALNLMPVQAQTSTEPQQFQPKTVTRIGPATKVIGALNMGDGSPWCEGSQMFWFVGHETIGEAPYCKQADGSWARSTSVVLDSTDTKSVLSGWKYIDRHDWCV